MDKKIKIAAAKGLNYEEVKKEALKNQPIQKKVSLANIDIDTNGEISYAGKALKTNDGVVEKSIFKILSLSPSFLKKFGKITSDKSKAELINMMKSALTLTDVKKSEITLVGSPVTNTITHILPGHRDIITNAFTIDAFERTMQQDPDLKLVGFEQSGTGLVLNVKKGIEVTAETKRGMLKGEEFNPGFSFSNSIEKGLAISSYIERLVCTNGMVQKKVFGDVNITEVSDDQIKRFFEQFASLQKNNFIPLAVGENIERAIETKASFHELLSARNTMLNNSMIRKDEDLYPYLPQFKTEVNKLAAKGYDYAKCSDAQLKNYPINVKVWDIVNAMTDFGSHDYGHQVDYSDVQKAAGNLFTKSVFDTENLLMIN